MLNMSLDAIKNTAFNQVGIIVKNIEQTVKDYWRILGIGPHVIITVAPVAGYDMTYKGKPVGFKFRASFAQVGPAELELIQSLEGPNIYEDYLKEHGEGANHLRSSSGSVAQIDAHLAALSRKGFSAAMTGRQGDIVGFAYIDTVSALKTVWETVKMPDGPPNVPFVLFPVDNKEISPARIKVNAISCVGLVVTDLEKVIAAYRDVLGIDNWTVQDSYPSIKYRGKNYNTRWKTGKTTAGLMQLELVQPLSENNIFDDFIHRQGEGIHHLQFLTDDIEETNRLMAAEGFGVLMEVTDDRGRYSFYDTQDTLKIIWEAIQLSTK